jgi:hypothetical protein
MACGGKVIRYGSTRGERWWEEARARGDRHIDRDWSMCVLCWYEESTTGRGWSGCWGFFFYFFRLISERYLSVYQPPVEVGDEAFGATQVPGRHAFVEDPHPPWSLGMNDLEFPSDLMGKPRPLGVDAVRPECVVWYPFSDQEEGFQISVAAGCCIFASRHLRHGKALAEMQDKVVTVEPPIYVGKH